MRKPLVIGMLAVLVTLCTASAMAQPQSQLPPDKGGFTRSMGIPGLTKLYGGAEFQLHRPSDLSDSGGLANFGLAKFLGHPVVGIAALGGEVYAGYRGGEFDAGGRAHFFVPSLMFGIGVDYNIEDNEADVLLRLDVPVRRGGIVGHGSALTVRWLPGRGNTFGLGLTWPMGDRDAGKTRPPHDYVTMDKRRPQRLDIEQTRKLATDELSILRERAAWVARLNQPFAEYKGADAAEAMAPIIAELRGHMEKKDGLFPDGHTYNEEIRVYHETLDRAFSITASASPLGSGGSTRLGRRISAVARQSLLDDVIFPYNYLFGQRKKNDSLYAMIAVAQTHFARWLLAETDIPEERALDVFFVFQTLCDIMDENRQELKKRWADDRMVWLPLQYGFKPDEHDSQTELNSIIERATKQMFAHGNEFWYIINEQFQFEMARSVRLAEDYHVLWIHDVSGVNHRGDPDELAFVQVKNYLTALCERVEAYDDTGKLPMYIILLDQHYFETNKSRLWMHLLEDPMDHLMRLPKKFDAWEQEIRDLQARLRTAVEESTLMRLERSQYGEKWLKNRVKVNVNITNPVDGSFYSYRVVGILPIPDNNMRDHRKIVFYDVTEDDPYRGMAMFTGMGIGEHYVGSNWEDRAVMVQGATALATKDAARNLLHHQGFKDDEIPFPLRPRPFSESYQDRINAHIAGMPAYMLDDVGVIQHHNETGFVHKPINVEKAILYSMMPKGSVLKVPDSLWQSYVYASLMAGSALRGCRSFVIAPTNDSAPSAGAPQMTRAHGLMSRNIVFGNEMDDYMEAEGGIFRVGMYAPRQGVGDIAGRMEQAVNTTRPWMDRAYFFHPSVDRAALNARAVLDSLGYKITYLTPEDSLATPKLHLKANFFASAAVWEGLMSQPEWGGIMEDYVVYLADQQGFDAHDARAGRGENLPDVRTIPRTLARNARRFFDRYLGSLSEEEKEEFVLYLTVGSTNMDYRSMVMNGEVQLTLSGVKSLNGVIDFILLAGLCEWPATTEELDALLAPPGWFNRAMASFIKVAL